MDGVERLHLQHYCDKCGKVIEGDVFVHFVETWKYHYHYSCFKLVMAQKRGGASYQGSRKD